MGSELETAIARLRAGEPIEDEALDVWLSNSCRRVAGRFWTPVEVARLAARWMVESGAQRVLDVGSGPGKFCLVAALVSELSLTGIEQRVALVSEASRLARTFGVDARCRFVACTIDAHDLTAYDALYVFNSFAENVYPPEEQYDASVELSPRRMRRDLLTMEAALDAMPLGGRLLTYHGFGGQIPDTFDLAREAPAGTGTLRFWQKARERSRGQTWVEVADEVLKIDDLVSTALR